MLFSADEIISQPETRDHPNIDALKDLASDISEADGSIRAGYLLATLSLYKGVIFANLHLSGIVQ